MRIRKILLPLFFALGILSFAVPASAANYTFPGTLPSGCSGSGPSYTCSTLNLAWGDTITVNSPTPATITINGNINVQNAQINWGGSTADLALIVNGALTGNYEPRIKANIQVSGNATIPGSTQMTGDLTVGGSLNVNSSTTITGNVTAAGAVTLGNRTNITGKLTGASISDSSGSCTLGGDLLANTGNIALGNQTWAASNVTATVGSITLAGSSRVTGNAIAGTTLELQGDARIDGDARSTGAATLAWSSRIDGTTNVGSLNDAGSSTFGKSITANTGSISLGTSSKVNGDVTATVGRVTLGHQTKVTGNILDNATSGGIVALGSSSQVNCALTKSTAVGSITLGWDAKPGGVCCLSGGSCLPTTNACYQNNSGRTISTTACAALATPNQVKVGSCTVSGVTATYPTVQEAVNAVADGGTVWICSGTYPETVSISGKVMTIQSVTGVASDVNIVSSANYSAVVATNRGLTVNNLTLSSSASGTSGISACPAAAAALSVSGMVFNITGSTGAGIYQGSSCQGLQLTAANISNSTSATSGIDIRNGTGNHVINNAVLHGANGWGWPVRITGGANITLTDVDAYQQGMSASYYPAISLSGFTGSLTVNAVTKTANRCMDINGNANAYPGVCISNRDTAGGTAQTNRASYGLSVCNAPGATSQVAISNVYASGSASGIGLSGGGSCGSYTASLSNVTAEVSSAYFSLSGSTSNLSSGHGWAYPITISNGTGTHALTNVTANGSYAFNGITINGGGATLTDVSATGLGWAVSITATGPVTVSNPTWAAANPYPATNPANFPIRGIAWNQIYGSGLSMGLSTTSATTLSVQNTGISGAGTGMWVNYNAYSYPNARLVMSNVTVDAAKGDGVKLFYGTGQAHSISNVTVTATGTAMNLSRGTGASLSNLNLTCGNDGTTAASGLILNVQSGAKVSGESTVTCKSPSSTGIYVGGGDGGCSNCTVGGATVDMQGKSDGTGIHSYNGGGSTITGNFIKNAPKYGIYVYDYPTTVTNNIVENSGSTNYGINMARGQGVAYNNCVYSPANHVITSQTSLCAGASPCNSSYPLIDPKPSATATKQGNFWGSWPKGTGFSDTCTDSNSDGLCDSATGGDNAPLKKCLIAADSSTTLVAHYQFDDTWGSSDTLDDSSGGNKPATLSGTVVQERATASGVKPDTCKAGNFNKLGYFTTVSGLDIDTAADKKNSVSFWMYWDGGFHSSSFTMPFSWGGTYYDLAVSKYRSEMGNGVIGFNTGNGDVYGVTAEGLANGWHHVAAVFNNGNVTQNKLYIDGVAKTLTSYGSHSSRSATGSAGIGAGAGWGGDYKWSGKLDNLKIYKGEITSAQIAADMADSSSCLPSLVSEWRFDELSWNGTAGEIKDSAGDNHGTAISATTSLGGRVCQAGNLTASGTADYLRFPEVGLTGRTDLSVALWVNTMVSKAQQELLQGLGSSTTNNQIELYLVNNNRVVANLQNSSNITFTSPVILTDGNWHHLVLTRQGSLGCLYVDGSLVGSCQTYPTGALSIAANTLLLGQEQDSYGGGFSSSQSLEGKVDELKIWDSPLTAAEVQAGYLNEAAGKNWDGTARTCAVTSAPANFNCVEVGGSASAGHLFTKLAGTAFSFDVVALKADGSVETLFASDADKTVTVELVDGSGTTACASRSALSPAISQTLTFGKLAQATELGRKSIQFTVGRAHADLRCRVTDASQTPPVKGCSADNFVIRPAGFSISSTNANADAAGTSTTATPKLKAGANFSLTAATGVAGYDGAPLVDLRKLAAHAGATQAGTLAGGFGTADVATGAASGTTFTYDEVGYFKLGAGGVFDASFATVDQTATDPADRDCSDDFSNTLVGGKYGCKIGNPTDTSYFGRFIPDHFTLVPSATVPGCGIFTYFGQDGFATPFTLTAQNSVAGTTQNYTGSFAKLGLANWNSFGFVATGLPAGSTLSASTTPPWKTDNPFEPASWSNGVASVTAKHQISRPTDLTGETKVTVSAKPTDSDDVTTPTSVIVATDTPLRFGRLRLFNAYGSVSPLYMQVEMQYWSGKSWVKNTDDSCTTTTGVTPQVTFSSSDDVKVTPSTIKDGAMQSGGLKLERETTGSVDVNATVPDWLKSPDGDNPTAKATFRVYGTKESRRTIHIRELY